jgi:competence ComEA-like helix-hairpin-helix protein
MISLTGLQHRFGFTRNEVALILVLSASLCAGAGIRWIRSAGAERTGVPSPAAYAAADSEFAARSAAADADTARPAPPRTTRNPSGKPRPDSASIDINAATASELVKLPGIGDAYARRIIAYRDGHGPFTRVDDLMHVAGIGARRFEALRPFVTVR